MEDFLFDLQQRFAATPTGCCSSQNAITSFAIDNKRHSGFSDFIDQQGQLEGADRVLAGLDV
jgi:hypothetical protein